MRNLHTYRNALRVAGEFRIGARPVRVVDSEADHFLYQAAEYVHMRQFVCADDSVLKAFGAVCLQQIHGASASGREPQTAVKVRLEYGVVQISYVVTVVPRA